MKKVIVNEKEKGFLFKDGKFVKLLEPGKYWVSGGKKIELTPLYGEIRSEYCPIEFLLADPKIAAESVQVVVGDEELALHFEDGMFQSVVHTGKHAFWKRGAEHTFRKVDLSKPEVDPDIPEYIFSQIPANLFLKVEVAEYEKARIFFRQKLEKILDAGTYYFWRNGNKVNVDYVDTRLTQMNVTGQEMLTLDKVSLRINFVCSYRVTDFVRSFTEIDDLTEQMHVAAQLALREYVGKFKLDEILENKAELSQFVFDRLKAREKDLFVEISDAGVKDIILPGEIREIMNTVLVAEKRAQANVIARREEVASTRSLLNTARLMEENQTLYKLKELEYVERICENVGNITLNGNGDVLSQLTGILRGGKS